LIDIARDKNYPYIVVPQSEQPRMAVISQLCAVVKALIGFGFISENKLLEISSTANWLADESANWAIDKPIRENLAKKIAMRSAGKTAIFYGGSLTAPVAYKWKISWNENAKNTAFWNELPESNHNEFIGWTSHPIEKSFAVFDFISNFENPQILKRFNITDKLLGGFRPSSMTVNLVGDTEIQQLLWGLILADFAGVYLAVLNGIDPTPVDLVNRLKAEINK
jgi:glucose/mannose-6-phosphate isomerase